MTRILESLAEIAEDYDALYCDLWGCFHDGIRPYPAAVEALRAFRRRGGAVVLLTNAPRPSSAVRRQLDRMGAPEEAFDAVVSSGDATREALASGRWGRRVEWVGPPRDECFFEGLDLERVGREAAEAVVVTGLYDDETETPAEYDGAVAAWRARGLPLLCANPDVIVDRGEERLWCAGAIAEAYAAAGGEAHSFGKPHAPIYRLAERAAAAALGRPPRRPLAVGDGVATDVAGAAARGIDAVFVTGGLAARDVSDDPERPDPARLRGWLEAAGARPAYAIGRLR
jgi:HAD superfamily hydrolase (TIGR01459 family)